jgi:shikimate kinase
MNLAQSLKEIASKANVEKHANIRNSYKYHKIIKDAKKRAFKGDYSMAISFWTNELVKEALREDGFCIEWDGDFLVLKWY